MCPSRDTTVALGSQNTGAALVDDQPRATLVFSHGEGSEVVTLQEGQALVIGRSAPADVAIGDQSLSRQHARFELAEARLCVEDLVSTNGTKVNGDRIKKKTCLRDGDELHLGKVKVAFQVVSPLHQRVEDLESYDRFTERLDEEVLRAKRSGRPFGLLMVRSTTAPAKQWVPQVGELLGELDRATLYGPRALLICMPEASRERALELARAITARPDMRCTAAVYPRHGTSFDALLEAARDALSSTSAEQPVGEAVSRGQVRVTSGVPIVASSAMRALYETAERVAKAKVSVLVIGETGSGKELLAQALHRQSGRSGPLRTINCGAIAESLLESALFGHEKGAFTGATARAKGLFEDAHRGTVMLDEVGELSAAAQASLLRVLETGKLMRVGSAREVEVDVRVVAATHRDLEEMAAGGKFRQDLLYRLNTIVLEVPPLRERRDEIMPLAESFLAAAHAAYQSGAQRLGAEAAALLLAHSWPGNVRELRNVIERAVVIATGEEITPGDLPASLRRAGGAASPQTAGAQAGGAASAQLNSDVPLKEQVNAYEISLLKQALEANQWNQTRTAQALGIPLRTLVHKLKKFNLQRPE